MGITGIAMGANSVGTYDGLTGSVGKLVKAARFSSTLFWIRDGLSP